MNLQQTQWSLFIAGLATCAGISVYVACEPLTLGNLLLVFTAVSLVIAGVWRLSALSVRRVE